MVEVEVEKEDRVGEDIGASIISSLFAVGYPGFAPICPISPWEARIEVGSS